MEVKEGYKLTEVGVIPEDWLLAKLSDLTTIIGDGIHATPDYIDSSGYYFINGNNLSDGDIVIFEGTKQVSLEEYTKYMKNLNDRTILMSINGTIGNLAYYNNEVVILGKSVCYINIEKATNEDFIYYQLQSKYVGNFYDNELTGSTIKNLSLNSVRNTPIVLPKSQEEQKAIATALSDIDGLINSLTRLIEKKKNIKQGAMQELLTGKKRLDSFEIRKGNQHTKAGIIPLDWELKSMGDLFDVTSSKRVFQSDWEKSGVPFFRARELAVLSEKGKVDNELFISEKMYYEYTNEYGSMKENDLLITGVGTLGKLYVVKKKDMFYFKDGNIIWLKTNGKANSVFIKYLYQTPLLTNQIQGSSSGTTVGTYTINNAKNTIIPVPSISEQTAIATILSDMDSEIETHQLKLDKYKAIKQGMMQELLTGRIRLLEGA